jgi:DNA gyrase/topoisomerase IV subunit A
VNDQRKFYSLYVLQSRAIPLLADGLKAAARRVLWVARNGDKFKTATLAGRALPLHPHAPPEGAINTLAAPYGNNIPLFQGQGAFGTLLNPSAYGAARYTSVKLSEFTKDVMFRDIDLVPMEENYDGTEMEPKHFLPLVPTIVLNPTSGIAVGFATNILPRDLADIIDVQLKVLRGVQRLPKEIIPKFTPLNVEAMEAEPGVFVFRGSVERVNTTTVKITSLSFNTSHEKYTDFLDKLVEQGKIVDYEDNSKDVIDIVVKFRRSELSKLTDGKLMTLLKLITKENENLTYIDIDGETVGTATAVEVVRQFTEWRLQWYYTRYEKRLAEVQEEIQRYRDILLAIQKKVGATAVKVQSRAELIDYLREIGIVNTDYIAGFPVYRFTIEEKEKTEARLKEALERETRYKLLLSDEGERRKVYSDELREILKRYNKDGYRPS